MVRKDSPDSGDTNDTTNALPKGTAAHVAPAPSLQATINTIPAGSGAQFPFVDPNVVMMTNAAATIAAVAASAVQHMTQAKPARSSGGNSPVPPGLAAFPGTTARSLLSSHAARTATPASNGQIPPHVAALLGAGATQPALPFPMVSQKATQPTSGASHVHGLTNTKVDGSSSMPGINANQGSLSSSAAMAAMSTGTMSNVLLPGMQTWSLEQLEQHVNLLHQMGQPVPQSVALLLADARRKEDKRTAKRVANRKSACTSRARKKALVEEMTRTNARLRRQALILALLPDLVIAITVDGEITFCSAQVERVLRYKIDDLIGAKLQDLLVPASRDALGALVKELVSVEKNESPRSANGEQQGTKHRRQGETSPGDAAEGGSKGTDETDNGNANSKASGRGSSRLGGRSGESTSAAAVVSEQSFPLSVVEVESKGSAGRENNVNSDASSSNDVGKQQAVSSLTNSTNVSRSPTDSFSGEDEGARRPAQDEGAAKAKRLPSSDDSSSLSSEAKNMRKANENLDRNVRWHNQRMMADTSKTKRRGGPKDDVTGASVTKNNATARLSSLKHVPEQSKRKDEKSRYESNGDQSSSDDSLLAGVEEKKKGENNSDDSGYRESNDSREETSSSGSDTSNSNGNRKKPMAPTCKVCLIREDLTTVWCEVTSSIRTRSLDEESPPDGNAAVPTSPMKPAPNSGDDGAPAAPMDDTIKELLLCLRPIRDGEKKVAESLRFKRKVETDDSKECFDAADAAAAVSSSSGDMQKESWSKDTSGKTSSKGLNSTGSSSEPSKRPPKKRPHPSKEAGTEEFGGASSPIKKKRHSNHGDSRAPVNASDTEKSVVESLMLMSNKSQ